MDPLRISMVGLSQWESVFVQTTVDLASGIDIASWRFVSDPESADVLFVDAERQSRLSLANGSDEDGPIVVSFSGEMASPGRGLVRPVSYADLIAVLKDIESELNEPRPPPAPKPEPTDPEPAPARSPERAPGVLEAATREDESLDFKVRAARRFVEGTRLIGLLKRIIDAGRPVEVTHAAFPTILVFPADRAYSSRAKSLAIPKLYRSSALEFEVRPVNEDAAYRELSSDRCRPLGRLVYSASLFGSEGRLLLRADPADKLKLVDWPDFDAVPHLSEHRTIAKYMLVHSSNLAEIAAATGVSIDKVIDFCNACEATGLALRTSANGVAVARGKLVDRMRDLFR